MNPITLPVTPTHLTKEGLESLAIALGITPTETQRPELMAQVMQRLGSERTLVLTAGAATPPVPPTPGSFWREKSTWALFISVLSLVCACLSAAASWRSSTTAVTQLNDSFEARESNELSTYIRSWQQVVIYNIIDKASGPPVKGCTFDDIKKEYQHVKGYGYKVTVDTVKGKKEISLDKQLPDQDLQKMLLDLQVIGMVSKSDKDVYFARRATVFSDFDRFPVLTKAQNSILDRITQQPGVHSLQELINEDYPKKLEVTHDEFRRVIYGLLSNYFLHTRDNDKLWPGRRP